MKLTVNASEDEEFDDYDHDSEQEDQVDKEHRVA